jgi:hypothetical protein
VLKPASANAGEELLWNLFLGAAVTVKGTGGSDRMHKADMKTYHLSFGTVTLLGSDLAEVIVNEGIEMDLDMVDEYHMFVSEFLADPCGTLINKQNRYTYTFEAQLAISNLDKIKAMAVLVHSEAARVATETLMQLPTHRHWNLRIFSDRDAGLRWLEQQVSLLKESYSPEPPRLI